LENIGYEKINELLAKDDVTEVSKAIRMALTK
jgi:hypothetical protein